MSTIPVYTAKELVNKVFPKPQWLIKPLLQRGGDWLLAGDPDAFKSLFLVQMCIHASLGLDYLFLKMLPEPLRILYINVDDNPRLVQKRLRSLTPKGQTLNDNFMLVCQPGIKFDQAGQELVKSWVIDYTPDIVIFDHLTELVPGGTSDHRGMQDYNNLQKWICSQDIGVPSIAHLNRTSKDNEHASLLRMIGGCNSIISNHSVITGHISQEKNIQFKHDRFEMHMLRNKNKEEKVEGEKHMIEVVRIDMDVETDDPWVQTFLREI